MDAPVYRMTAARPRQQSSPNRNTPLSRTFEEPATWRNVVPLAVSLAVILAEFGTPDIRITPSLLTISLAAFSLFLRPQAIIVWSAALLVPVVASLIFIPTSGVFEDPVVITLRVAAFLVVAALAYGLARGREKARKQIRDLVSLLDALRNPVMVSDIDGLVLYANRHCCEILGQTDRDVIHANFFSLFGFTEPISKTVEKYVTIFFQTANHHSPIKLEINALGEAKWYEADCSVLEIDETPYMISQIRAAKRE